MKILVIGLELYCGGHFYFGCKAKYQKKTTELPQATNKVASKKKKLYTSILTTLVKAPNYISRYLLSSLSYHRGHDIPVQQDIIIVNFCVIKT